MAIKVFQKDQGDKFVKENKEGKTVKHEDVGLKPIERKYLHCHQTGCAPVSELHADIQAQSQAGGVLAVEHGPHHHQAEALPVAPGSPTNWRGKCPAGGGSGRPGTWLSRTSPASRNIPWAASLRASCMRAVIRLPALVAAEALALRTIRRISMIPE